AAKAEPAVAAPAAAANIAKAVPPAAPIAPKAAPAQHNHAHGHVTAQAGPPPSPATPAAAPKPAAPKIAGVEGDVTHGRQVYKKCQACHSLQPGRNTLGPNLAGIIGRKAAAEANYSYSPAMKQ